VRFEVPAALPKFLSSWMWRCAVWQRDTDISRNLLLISSD